MRSTAPLLLLVVVPLAVAPAVAPDDGPREDPMTVNRRLLERWKADPDHHARLTRDFKAFWALPAEERAALRRLDQELHQQDSATQNRLWGVLERYNAWYERLPDEDRRRIQAATDPRERAEVVRDIQERQWIRRLPEPVRNHLATLGPEERQTEIERLREEQRQRVPRPRKDRPTRLSEFPAEVEVYVRDALTPLLTSADRDRLARTERRPWPLYARTLMELSDRYPIPLPGPIGPVRISDLPPNFQQRLKPIQRDRLARAEGKWPEFGVALLSLPGKRPGLVPPRTMPSTPAEFPQAIREFIDGPLDKKLTPEEKAQLKAAEGKWPEYPRQLLELARKHKLAIPGMSLPAVPELWDRARTALPDVPERTLMHFAVHERRGAKGAPPLLPMDPVVREKLKAEYFQKHPRELRRLQKLDSSGFTSTD
jgi:hypothetical protein